MVSLLNHAYFGFDCSFEKLRMLTQVGNLFLYKSSLTVSSR